MAAKTQFFSIYISAGSEVSVTPVKQNVLNEFDFIGEAEGLLRLANESNSEYKQRIMDLKVHKGGPSYKGIVNNLSRAFGTPIEKCMTITLKTDSSGDNVAISPRIDFLADRVVLYSDWRPNGTEVIDKTIYIYNPTDEGYFVEDLVSEINSSNCFSSTLESDIRPNMHSTNIIMDTSSKYIRKDVMENQKRTVLAAELITKDSIIFDETSIFETEVSSEPAADGEFLVDYINGIVESYSVPKGTRYVSYYYANFPLEIEYSPIKIYSLGDDNFYNSLFQKETLPSGEEINTMLTTEGTQILNYMYKELPVFWGE